MTVRVNDLKCDTVLQDDLNHSLNLSSILQKDDGEPKKKMKSDLGKHLQQLWPALIQCPK